MNPAPQQPTVLFVCVHNAGRSQMAAGYLRHFSNDQVIVRSAGSEPADQLNPLAVEVMAEEGIDITETTPRLLTDEAVHPTCGIPMSVFEWLAEGLSPVSLSKVGRNEQTWNGPGLTAHCPPGGLPLN